MTTLTRAIKIIGLLLLITALTGCGWFGLSGPSFKSDLRLKVAVMPFEDRAGVGGDVVEVNTAKLVTEKLAKSDRLVLVPYTEVLAYMESQGIPSPLSQNTATVVGRGMGLNALVLGYVTEVSQVTKRKGWRRYLRFFTDRRDYITAVLATEVVDVARGVLLGADTGRGEIMAGKSLEDFFLNDRTGSFTQASVAASMDEAVEELSENVLEVLSQADWQGFITRVEGDQAVLSAGSDVGIKPGDSFVVYDVANKITNAAGQTFSIPGKVKATLEAVQVSDRTARLKILSGSTVMGEIVRYID
jgi:hypothetical protein